MLAMALLFATASAPLMAVFAGSGTDATRIVETGTLLMKFVAFYCLFDAVNVMLGCVLASAGDTQWIARIFFVCSTVFLCLLWLIDRTVPSLFAEWTLATSFVFATALIWSLRFRAGEWRKIEVIADTEAPLSAQVASGQATT
jgi:MATE family multidrug resistance protein